MGIGDDLRKALSISREKHTVKMTEAPTIKKTETGKFAVPAKFAVVQADLIYMKPDKKGYNYILTVVDVSSRAMDAIPLRGRESEDVIEGFEQVWKHKYIDQEKMIFLYTDPGSEFKNDKFHKYMEEFGIKVRHTMTARKNQTGIVEYYNGILTKYLGQKATSEELETGNDYDNWSEGLPKMVEVLNKKEYEKTPKLSEFFGEPKVKPNEKLLNEGDVVHVRLQQPIDHMVDTKKVKLHGGFRSGDLRWEKGTTTIDRVLLYPHQPVRYMVRKYNNVSFLRKELLLASEDGTRNQRENDQIEDTDRQRVEHEKATRNTHTMVTRSKGKRGEQSSNDPKYPHMTRE